MLCCFHESGKPRKHLAQHNEIYVNTVVDDGTDIADLMNCFTKKQVNNPKFPVLSEEVDELKTSERGVMAVCDVMRHYEGIARAEGKAEGRAEGLEEGMQQEKMNIALKLLQNGMGPGFVAEATGLTPEQIKSLEASVN